MLIKEKNKIGMFRWVICFLLFCITTINYMDRQIIGLLEPDYLAKEFGWNEIDYANITAAFLFAYAIGPVLMGIFIDKIGVRYGMFIVAFFWSLATAMHAAVHEFNILGLTITSTLGFMFCRVCLGIFEGGNFPAAIRAVSTWFPKKEVSLANGLFNSGSNMGAIVAPVIVPILAVQFGWRMSFLSLGVIGVVWVVFWLMFYNSPRQSKYVKQSEIDYIESDSSVEEQKNAEPENKISWLSLFKNRSVLAYAVGMAMSSPIWWFYLFWIPKFLKKEFNLSVMDQMPMLAAIYLIAAIGSVAGGAISSWFITRGKSLNFARKTSLLICALCVLPVFFAPIVPSAWVATLLVGLAGAAHQGFSANLYAIVCDVAPKKVVASVTGIGTTMAAVVSLFCFLVVGHVLEAMGSYTGIFAVASLAYVVATLIMQIISPKLDKIRA
ncbi:MAG: MFS transporter [Opitutales bacterium]|nr:MFS transporter [Opitutales bacterium]